MGKGTMVTWNSEDSWDLEGILRWIVVNLKCVVEEKVAFDVE